MVTINPITSPATRSAHAPHSPASPTTTRSIDRPADPPACAASPKMPTSAITATVPALVGIFGLAAQAGGSARSEEHTSELQSRSDLVCRLLLEKKKKKKHIQQS